MNITNDSLKIFGSVITDTSINEVIRQIKTSINSIELNIADSLRTFEYSQLNNINTQLNQIANNTLPLNETAEHVQLTASGTDNNGANTLRGIGISGSFDAIYDVTIDGNTISYDVSQGLQFADYNVANGTINEAIDITCTQGTIIISKLK